MNFHRRLVGSVALTVGLGWGSVAAAQGASPAPEPAPPAPPPFTFGGYVEAAYSFNFGQPSNGITNARGFDNRHNTFTLSNVALDGAADWEGVVAKLTLQVGHTPDTYYLAEPSFAGSGAANATGAPLWKYVQQAYAGYRFPVGRSSATDAGHWRILMGLNGMTLSSVVTSIWYVAATRAQA